MPAEVLFKLQGSATTVICAGLIGLQNVLYRRGLKSDIDATNGKMDAGFKSVNEKMDAGFESVNEKMGVMKSGLQE
ncbi:hypothetical protein BGX38DRAFT_1171567 [Terfezia claveryi]|nr:hypothetical protein BGX38DRAFT_1171567 [Terfezia claveryi]